MTPFRFDIGASLHPPGPLGVTVSDPGDPSASVRLGPPHGHGLVLEAEGGSAREFAGLFGLEPGLLTPPEERAFRTMGAARVDAVRALPRPELKRRLRNAAQTLSGASEAGAAYLPHYLRGRRFLDGLAPYAIDPDALRLAAAEDSDRDKLSALSPWAGPPTRTAYSMTGTVTGRLTVTAGPNLLVAPRSARPALRDPDGARLWEADLTALEPTILFALQVPGFDPGPDLYAAASARWFGGELPRSAAKALVISACYGASERALLAAAGRDAADGVRRMRSDLGLSRLADRLREEWADTGRILNAYGRPVRPKGANPRPGALVNNLVQSTAVDAALGVFDRLSRRPGVTPRAVIHDALYLSADPEALADLRASASTRCDIINGVVLRHTITELRAPSRPGPASGDGNG